MTRAKTELATVLLAAIALLVFLAWYQGSPARGPGSDTPASNQVVRTGPVLDIPVVRDTTLIVGPLDGTIQEAPPPEAAGSSAEQDRKFIADAFPALSSWSLEEVKPLLSTAAIDATTDIELQQVMDTLSARLGQLQYFDEPQPAGDAGGVAHPTNTASLQSYRFTAYYEAGAAEVSLVLEKQQQHSSLYSFDIHVPNQKFAQQ